MNTGAILTTSYDYPLVVFSAVVCILAAYTALDLAERGCSTTGGLRAVWLSSSALVMGIGIWAMHYIGMPSFVPRLSLRYDWPTALLTLLLVCAAAGLAFFASACSRSGVLRAAGGLSIGAGITAMNYGGLAAMRFAGSATSSPLMAALSIIAAAGISFLALTLAFAHELEESPWAGRQFAGALLLGLAPPAAHYVWMAGAVFHSGPVPQADLPYAVSISQFGLGTFALVSLVVLAHLSTVSRIDSRLAVNKKHFLQSQLQLKTVFDNLAEGIAVLDLEGNILLANEHTAHITGFNSSESMRGKLVDLADAFTPAGVLIPVAARPAALALKGQFVYGCEVWLRARGKQPMTFVEISTAPIPGPNGGTAQIIVNYRDITERRRSDEARSRLAAIVESSEDAIIGLDDNGSVTSWNRGAEKIFGYTAQEISGESVTRLLPADREGEEEKILERIRRGEIVEHYETVRQCRNGRLIDVSLTVSPVRDSTGIIVGASKIARNITESKRQKDALHESQQRLQGIIDSAMDAIITIDRQKRIVLFNAAAEKMFGCSQFEAMGGSIDRFIPERFRSAHAAHIDNFSETGMTSRAMGELGALWARRANGEEFQIEASISQLESGGYKLFTVILRDVTDRVHAAEVLREQAQFLNASQVLARDMQDHVVLWSEGAQKIYGYTPDQALGKTSHDLFQTEFPEPLDRIRMQLLETGRWEGELVHRHSNGNRMIVSSLWILHCDKAGRPIRILECISDVTARKHADELLQEQSHQLAQQAAELARSQHSLEEKTLMLQSVLDSMSEGLVAADEQGRFMLWNPAAERIVGMGPSATPAEHWNQHYGVFFSDGETPLPTDQNPLTLAIAGQANSAIIFVRNEKVPDGAYLEIYASPLRDSNGATRGGVTAFRNITERRRAEEKARQSEEKFAKAFRSSPIGMSITTLAEGRYVDVNQSLLKMIGYEESEVVGHTSTELNIWWVPGQRAEMLATLRRNSSIRSLEVAFRTKQGTMRAVSISMETISLDGLECILTTATDVTETKNLEQQLRQSQKMEALGQLTGGIAHDFNNLLGVIVGNLDLLERSVARDETALKRVQAAQRASLRGADLTRRLLAFSRREQLNPAPVAVEPAIEEMVALAARTLGPEIKISIRCDADLPQIFVDAAALENALLNLALNARDAMPKGGSLIVSAHLTDLSGSHALAQAGELTAGDYVRIAVSDTGHGMSRETLERAFEPFFTTKPRDKGTGLGLAMVYGFIKQSGGAIRLYSEPGFGTTVSLYLPLAGTDTLEHTADEPAKGTEGLGGVALLVDDEADLLDIADAFLCDLGYTVIRAGDGAAALAALETAGRIDLMVTDIIMPGGLNGIELARKVRELRPGIKVIYTSGFPAEALTEWSGKLEGGPLLHKPYQRAEFADMVRRSVCAKPD
jgi:PAS domain S-box-containing protein